MADAPEDAAPAEAPAEETPAADAPAETPAEDPSMDIETNQVVPAFEPAPKIEEPPSMAWGVEAPPPEPYYNEEEVEALLEPSSGRGSFVEIMDSDRGDTNKLIIEGDKPAEGKSDAPAGEGGAVLCCQIV